jgi:hypothetical protein
MRSKELIQCNGIADTFFDDKRGIDIKSCIHWETISRRKKVDIERQVALAVVFDTVTATLIKITII